MDRILLGIEHLAQEHRHTCGLGCVARRGIGGVDLLAVLRVHAVLDMTLEAAVGRGWVSVGKACLLMLQSELQGELEDDGEEEENTHDGQRTNSLDVIGGGDSKETDEADLREVNTSKQLAESLLIGLALGVQVGLVNVEEVVPESDVDESEADRRETEDERCDARVGDTNDSQVDPLGVLRSPRWSRELGKLVEDLARCLAGQDAAKEHDYNEASDVEQSTGGRRETQQDEVTDVKVRGLGKVGSEKLEYNARVLKNLVDDGRDGARQSCDKEHLDNLESEVPALALELNLTVGNVSGQLGHQATDDRYKSHEDGKHDSWQETGNHTKNDLGDVQNPFEPGKTISEVVDVGDQTDKGDCIS